MANTAFGNANVTEEIRLPQSANGKKFETRVQLLETEDGESLVRVCYTTDGIARRGPVTVRTADLKRLARLLEKTARLRAVIAAS